MYNGECMVHCPIRTYMTNDRLCSDCHYSCYRCNGPNDYQCTSCWGDAEFTYLMGQTFCYSKNIKSLLDNKTWNSVSIVLLTVNIFLLLVFCKKIFWPIINRKADDGDYRLANQFEGYD